MKKNVLLYYLLIASASAHATPAGDTTAAIVNGKVIKSSEISSEIMAAGLGNGQIPEKKAFSLVRDRHVDMVLLIQAAKKSKVSSDPKVKEALARAEDRLLLQAFVEQHVQGSVTAKAVEEATKKSPTQYEVSIRHILLKDRTTALRVIEALKNGKDFHKIAKEKSIDPSKEKGGLLPPMLEKQLPPELRTAVQAMNPGGFSQAPLQTPMGFHVLKLDEKRVASPEALESQIRNNLEKQALMQLLDKLRASAKIQCFQMDGKPDDTASAPSPLSATNKPKKKRAAQ